jgi:hypothetical protein
MMLTTTFPPDLLRRFTPTPYVFSVFHGQQRVWIETNDLEIALNVRRFCVLDLKEKQAGVLSWKLIRDDAAPVGGSEILILINGSLRTLHLGTGTIIIYDTERLELLCFIANDVTVENLIAVLIPLLTRDPRTDREVFPGNLQISDKQNIAL